MAVKAQEIFPLSAEPSEESPTPEEPRPNFLFGKLSLLEYATALRFEYDDNIFASENDQSDDFKQILSQLIKQKIHKGDHYGQWTYAGEYSYYDQESAHILSHIVEAFYSYRPFDQFSMGIGNNFRWLSDSTITTTLGDRVLALGYTQINPDLMLKYNFHPRFTFITDVQYKKLDAKDGNLDDYVDHDQSTAVAQLDSQIDSAGELMNHIGFERTQTTFPQISEKASVVNRGLVGFTKKFPGLIHVTAESGFSRIDMDDDNVNGDDNIDYKIAMETVFSVYSKLKLSYQANLKQPSLRREYTQYASNMALLELTHTLSPKDTLQINYSFEKQHFNESNTLAGQPDEDKKTFIKDLSLAYSHKLNSWLTWNLGYNFIKRDTDFTNEGYTNNKYMTGLTLEY